MQEIESDGPGIDWEITELEPEKREAVEQSVFSDNIYGEFFANI